MRPIVRFLLRHGVTWDEFSELTKDMYVDVAIEGYGLQGRPTNNSRVAMMTGLSRREVARIRDRLLDDCDDPAGRRGSRVSQILTGWHVDEEFTEAGQPKDLLAHRGVCPVCLNDMLVICRIALSGKRCFSKV